MHNIHSLYKLNLRMDVKLLFNESVISRRRLHEVKIMNKLIWQYSNLFKRIYGGTLERASKILKKIQRNRNKLLLQYTVMVSHFYPYPTPKNHRPPTFTDNKNIKSRVSSLKKTTMPKIKTTFKPKDTSKWYFTKVEKRKSLRFSLVAHHAGAYPGSLVWSD